MSRIKQKYVSALLIIGMLFSMMGTTWAAENSSSDISGHWAETELKEWVSLGLLSGYKDGSYRPNHTISRGELMALINRSFGLKEKANISFTDLKETEWAYEQVAIAVKAGYVQGYDDGTIRTGNTVSREEAASMIAKLLGLNLKTVIGLEQLSDTANIADWSKPAVSALLSEGIINGYPNGSYRPKGSITRAESVIVLSRALATRNKTYSVGGTYGPEIGTETIKGNVIVNVTGVTLQNLIIEGNLTLAAGIGEGDVFLNNIKVNGTTRVEGGGDNSVHFKNSVLVHIIVNKTNGSVRIVAEGATSVQNVTVQSSAKVEESGITGNGFTNIELAKELPQNSIVKLLGQFENVNIEAKSIRVEIPSGSINNLNVSNQSGELDLNLGEQAKVVKLVLDAVVKLTGQGVIENATVNEGAKDTTFDKQPEKTEGSGMSEQPSTTTGGGSSGGGSSGDGTDQQPSVNQYELKTLSNVYFAGNALTLNVNANNQLVDNSGDIISDPFYLHDKRYIVPSLTVKQNNGQHYSGKVRITATAVTASQDVNADDVQLFAFHDGSSDYWTNVLKAGFGEAEGQSIDSLMNKLTAANKWFIVAKPGIYMFRIQIEDAVTQSIIAQSDVINVNAENLNLSELSIDGYEFIQLDQNRIGEIGTGFDPNNQHYQIHIPNNVSNVTLQAVSDNDATIEVRQSNPWIMGESGTTTVAPVEGSFNLQIPAGLMPTITIFVKTEHATKIYDFVIFRFNDPVGDPSQLDETDIRVKTDSIVVPGLNNSVTVSVYGSESGDDLLASVITPNASQAQSPINMSVPVTFISVKGTIWISIYDPETGETTPRLAKNYNATPVAYLANPTGVSIDALTAEEITEAQSHGYGYATTGFKLTLNHSALPSEIQNFAYFTYGWSSQSNTIAKAYDEIMPSERGAMVSKGSSGTTIHNFYESESGNYYRIIFFDENDNALGFIEVLDTPNP